MARIPRGAAKRRFKDDVYAALARVPSAIANPHRLELLELVAQRARTVQDLAEETTLSVANASQHLGVLARAGLVTVDRRGTFAFYRAAGPSVSRLVRALRDVAEQHDTEIARVVAAHFGDRDAGIADISAIRALIDDPRVALLDTRPTAEFAAGHLPRAINAPLDALYDNTVTLPRSKRYIAYCRGPYCTFADEAVALLRKRGFSAERLALGPADWEAAGEAVERAG